MNDEPIKASPLTWPEDWGRAPFRKAAKFANDGNRLTISQGTKRVLYELERLNVGHGNAIISSDLRLKLDGTPYSDQPEPTDPGIAVYWRKNDQSPMRVMAIDIYTRVADNLAAVAATLEAMRAIERHGGAQILERAFTGFTALPAPASWRSVLDFEPSQIVTADGVNKRFRDLAKVFHPDGGERPDANRFREIVEARERALAEIG